MDPQMDEFLDLSSYQDQAVDPSAIAHQQQHFAHAANAHLHDQTRGALYHPGVPPMSCEVKPRLTKEQAELLERRFQEQHKPSTSTKKGYAEKLGVSLDKVNNWFQNRRAKSKQDAKKAAEQLHLYEARSQNFGSDSEPSPFQPSQQYAAMMHSEENLANGLGISQMSQAQAQVNGLPYSGDLPSTEQLQNFGWAQGLSTDLFDPNFDPNRRTLTQENFDAWTRNGGAMNGAGQFESLDTGFLGDQQALSQVFPTYDVKGDNVPFGYPNVAAPLSSNDSTVPSINSEQSMHAFPSSNVMQSRQSISGPGSEWADSRSSSLNTSQLGHMGAPMAHAHQAQVRSPWEPGKSVPVNYEVLRDEFEQAAAQANQANQVRASMDQAQLNEQPLAYPIDDAYARRGSTASMLAQSMVNVGIHTPQPNQSNGVFKSPAPPIGGNIAARRQRAPKPANLGLAALRSQSFGGPGQPASPGHQHNNVPAGLSIRRVVSTNVLNGSVSQGRVMKSGSASAQRSPLNWTFAEAAVNSPHLVRALSHGNLAPPTPMSPSHPSQAQQMPNWQNGPNQDARHPSISEHEEHGVVGVAYQPSASVPSHVSPPHTPHWFQQPFAPQRIGSNVITENTPPQSAPASQSCFPSNVFSAPPPPNPHMAAIANSQQQQYLNLAVPEPQLHMSNVTFAPTQHANVVSSGPPPGAAIAFAEGIPVMNADGNYQMAFQMMQPQSQSPPQMPYAFVNSNGASPPTMSMQPPKLASQAGNDFVVHEYSPPDSLKRSITPRKAMDSGPKNYTFANAGPIDYEEKKAKKADSSSPASSSGTASTS